MLKKIFLSKRLFRLAYKTFSLSLINSSTPKLINLKFNLSSFKCICGLITIIRQLILTYKIYSQ